MHPSDLYGPNATTAHDMHCHLPGDPFSDTGDIALASHVVLALFKNALDRGGSIINANNHTAFSFG